MLQNTIISKFLPDVYLETKEKQDVCMHHKGCKKETGL
jgi:hypothetical protein